MKKFLKKHLTHALTTQESKIEFWLSAIDVSYEVSGDCYEVITLSLFNDDEDKTSQQDVCHISFRQKNDSTGETKTKSITIPMSEAIELVEFIVKIQSDMNEKELINAPVIHKKASNAVDDFVFNTNEVFKVAPGDVIEIQDTSAYKDSREAKKFIRFTAYRGEEKLTLMALATNLLKSNWLGSCEFILNYTNGQESLNHQRIEIPFFLFQNNASLKEFAPKPCKSQLAQEKEFVDFIIDKSSVANYVHLNEELNSNQHVQKRVKI